MWDRRYFVWKMCTARKTQLLRIACSQPVQVMANNNIFNRADHIPLDVTVKCCYFQTCLASSQGMQKPDLL